MRIFEGVPWGEAQMTVRWSRTPIFSFFMAVFLETLELRPTLLHRYTASDVAFSVIPKSMTLNDPEWLFRVKLCFRAGFCGFRPCDFRKLREN